MSWSLVSISEFCETGSGGTPSRKQADFYEGNIPWIKSGDLREKTVTKATEFITELAIKKSSAKIVPKGAILVAMYGATVGRMAMLGINAATNQAVCSIVPDEKKAFPKYVYYALLNKVPDFLRNAVGGAQPNISQGMIKDTKILLPYPEDPEKSLKEQKRIADILDKADGTQHKRKQAIQLADVFLRSVFLDMFGDPVMNPKEWPVNQIKVGLQSITSGWSAKGESTPCNDGGLGVLKISAVTSGTFKPFENKAVNWEAVPANKKLIFPRRGDLIFSRANTRELVAATCIVQEDRDDVFLPDKLWLVKTDKYQLLPEFLNFLIWHPKFKELLTSQATGTSGSMLNISKAKFESTETIFPDLATQNKFKDIYWKTLATLENSISSEKKIGDLFGSLSSKAFSGKL